MRHRTVDQRRPAATLTAITTDQHILLNTMTVGTYWTVASLLAALDAPRATSAKVRTALISLSMNGYVEQMRPGSDFWTLTEAGRRAR